MTTVGWRLFCIALGAILKWAITAEVAGIDLHIVGAILIVVGAVGLCIGLVLLFRGRSGVNGKRGYR
jgi:hypothetical protein